MEIKTLKDLDKLATLCRKKGIKSIKIGEIAFELGAEAPPSRYLAKKLSPSTDLTSEPQYTPDDILNWSVNGIGREMNDA